MRVKVGENRLKILIFGKVIAVLSLIGSMCLIGCRREPAQAQQPTIEASPLGNDAGQWKVVASDTVRITVTAPGAERVKIQYRPVVAVKRHVELKTLSAPAGDGKFSTELKAGPDFVGHLWAEAYYPGGAQKNTEPLSLASEAAISAEAGDIPVDSIGGSVKTDESARADKITHGKIEQASLTPDDSRIWITVDVPAFRLTLWQAGKEVKTYQIGIGRKEFPLPTGDRKATEIVLNPEWVPPESDWVLESEDVEPGERIEADDPRNPLGKVKIRLGQGILIHEAAKPTDLGHLVSHGCVRMLTDDIFDLTLKIVSARGLPVTNEQLERAKTTTQRMSIKLAPPVWVDINYDTDVVESNVLHLYPNVYNRGTTTPSSLVIELQAVGVDLSKIDAKLPQQMIRRVSLAEEFLVKISDIKSGMALTAGENRPLTEYSKPAKPQRKRKRR